MCATRSHKTQQKTRQMDIDKTDTAKKCMQFKMLKNTVGSKYCQISSQKLNKTHKVCSTIVQSQLRLPQYMNLSGTQIHLACIIILHDISSNDKCSTCTTYEAHCLRAVTIQLMNDAGLDLRHIMHKNGHKNEVSVRISNCDSSMQQKKTKSAILMLLWVSKNPRFLILNRAQ